MKKTYLVPAVMLAVVTGLSSCSVISGIFKAGVWAGILFVVVIIAVIIGIITMLFKKK